MKQVITTATDDVAKAEAFALRAMLFSFSCKLDEFAHEPQCKARALSAAIKREADPVKKQQLQPQQDAAKNVTPDEKKQEVAAGKRMYAAYCARSAPPEPKVCANDLVKKQLGGRRML